MLTKNKKALYEGNTIGCRLISANGTDQKNWIKIQLSTLNHRLISLELGSKNPIEDKKNYDVLAPFHQVAAVAGILKANFLNPIHYGDNKPGFFNQKGESLIPEPQFTYWDLFQYGVSGENGFAGFVRDCQLPVNTSEFSVLIATGLLLVDSAAESLDRDDASFASYLLGQAQDCSECAFLLSLTKQESGKIKIAIQSELKNRGANAAKARYTRDKDGKQALKAWVYECWQAWQLNTTNYKGDTEFARDMLDKEPDKLKSEVVITRWARKWKSENK